MNTPQESHDPPSPELAILTALCLAAGRNGQAPDVRAKDALVLAKAIRDAVAGDVPPPPPEADGPVLERGTIGASMLQRQVGEANSRILQLEELLRERDGVATAAHERVVGLEAELAQVKADLATARAATSTGTTGPAPRPPKGKPESKPEE